MRVIFDLDLILLLIKVNPILKKQNYKKYVFIAHDSNSFKIIPILQIKIITFYILVFIIQIRVFGFEKLVKNFISKFLLVSKVEIAFSFFYLSLHKPFK